MWGKKNVVLNCWEILNKWIKIIIATVSHPKSEYVLSRHKNQNCNFRRLLARWPQRQKKKHHRLPNEIETFGFPGVGHGRLRRRSIALVSLANRAYCCFSHAIASCSNLLWTCFLTRMVGFSTSVRATNNYVAVFLLRRIILSMWIQGHGSVTYETRKNFSAKRTSTLKTVTCSLELDSNTWYGSWAHFILLKQNRRSDIFHSGVRINAIQQCSKILMFDSRIQSSLSTFGVENRELFTTSSLLLILLCHTDHTYFSRHFGPFNCFWLFERADNPTEICFQQTVDKKKSIKSYLMMINNILSYGRQAAPA